ncbi:hypothetical protein G6F31_021108 [Rhizopus arrhizus]|nr:hypothetical protein G6F31_021108 [Rhizopus arrhizus]
MEATMVKDRDLSAFTMEINPKGSEETESRQSQDGCTYHTQLAEPILVANGFTSEHSKTINLQSEQTMVLDRMEVIRAYQLQIENLTEGIIDYLQQSNKITTHTNYDLQWKRWAT